MAVVATGELDVRLSKETTARLQSELTATAHKAGAKAGTEGGQAFGSKFSGKLGGVLTGLEGKFREFGKTGEASLKPLTLAQGGIAKLSGALESLGPAGIAGGIAIGAVAAAAFKGIGHFVELAAQIRKFKSITGESAEEASVFVVGLRELGVSSDQVARGLSRLARQSSAGKEPLKDLGVQIARTADGNFDAIGSFKEIADKIKGSTDAAYRNELAFKAFGRAGLELIPILSRGADGMEEFEKIAKLRGEIFTDKDLKAARDYSIATRSLGEAFDALEISLGKRVVPLATNVTLGLTRAIDQTTHNVNTALNHLPGLAKNFASNVAGATVPLVGFVHLLADIGNNSDKSAASLGRLHAAEQKFSDAAKKDLDEVSEAFAALTFTQNTAAQGFIGTNVRLGNFTDAASGAAIVLSTDLKTGVTDYTKALKLLDPIAARVAEDQYKISVGLDPIAAKFDLAAAAADQFNQALGYSLGPVEDFDKATIGVGRAEEAVTKLLREGKATRLDQREATLQLVDAIQQAEAAHIRETGGIITAQQARINFLRAIDEEIKKYPSLRGELERYRAEIERTPDEKLINFTQQGLTGKGGIQTSMDTLNDTLKELTKVFEIKFGIDPGNTYIEIDKIKAKLGTLPKGAFTYIDFVGGRGNISNPKELPARASGGAFPAGWTGWVGENGPEIVRFGQPGTVINNTDSRKMAGNATTNITVNEVHADPRATAFAVATALGREGTR